MPEMEAIQSATSVAAKFLGIENTHGSIEIGKQADLIAVAKDPLRDISSLENINFVMKAGLIYKNEL
jgi:imidazolonepropionase-like amidohydrolase